MRQWCVERGRALGALLTLEQLWALAQAWYHDRMQPEFRGRTLEQAQAIFQALGLDDAFWSLDATGV